MANNSANMQIAVPQDTLSPMILPPALWAGVAAVSVIATLVCVSATFIVMRRRRRARSNVPSLTAPAVQGGRLRVHIGHLERAWLAAASVQLAAIGGLLMMRGELQFARAIFALLGIGVWWHWRRGVLLPPPRHVAVHGPAAADAVVEQATT